MVEDVFGIIILFVLLGLITLTLIPKGCDSTFLNKEIKERSIATWIAYTELFNNKTIKVDGTEINVERMFKESGIHLKTALIDTLSSEETCKAYIKLNGKMIEVEYER